MSNFMTGSFIAGNLLQQDKLFASDRLDYMCDRPNLLITQNALV